MSPENVWHVYSDENNLNWKKKSRRRRRISEFPCDRVEFKFEFGQNVNTKIFRLKGGKVICRQRTRRKFKLFFFRKRKKIARKRERSEISNLNLSRRPFPRKCDISTRLEYSSLNIQDIPHWFILCYTANLCLGKWMETFLVCNRVRFSSFFGKLLHSTDLTSITREREREFSSAADTQFSSFLTSSCTFQTLEMCRLHSELLPCNSSFHKVHTSTYFNAPKNSPVFHIFKSLEISSQVKIYDIHEPENIFHQLRTSLKKLARMKLKSSRHLPPHQRDELGKTQKRRERSERELENFQFWKKKKKMIFSTPLSAHSVMNLINFLASVMNFSVGSRGSSHSSLATQNVRFKGEGELRHSQKCVRKILFYIF